VFHVDAVVHHGAVVFADAHQYRTPLLDVVQGGGGMVTTTVSHGSALETALLELHARVVRVLGLQHGVTHGEYLRDNATGALLFLEIAARVGGAHIPSLVRATAGVDLWRAYVELELDPARFVLPSRTHAHGALFAGLSREAAPDLRVLGESARAWTLEGQPHQLAFVLRDDSSDALAATVEAVAPRFASLLR
jgi:hypothetical protein